MQADDQQSAGYDYQPLGVDLENHPASLELRNGEQYTVRGLFGQGGFSTVYRVRDRNGQQYAAKVIMQRDRRYPTHHEIETYQRMAQTPHINLLMLHTAGELTNPPPGFTNQVFITEACGPSIKDMMLRVQREIEDVQLPKFSIDAIKRIGRQIGEALLHLEKLKIYHLDIKAANVTFSSAVKHEVVPHFTQPIITMSDLRIKIIDYGNSLSHSIPGIPRRHKMVQPQNLRAPEVFLGIPHNEKSDVWSLGCLIGEMYLGRGVLFIARLGVTQAERQQSQFELMVARMDPIIPRDMIEMSRRGRRCTLDLNFLDNRQEVDSQDFLLNLMREESDYPLFQFLQFALIFNPAERPSFEEVLNHEFLTNF
ncbi:unnamed protein product [Caenorhabditis nigoni]